MLAGNEIKATFEGATISRVEVAGGDDDGEIFALELTTGKVFMLRGGWNGEVGIDREDREGIWFKDEEGENQ